MQVTSAIGCGSAAAGGPFAGHFFTSRAIGSDEVMAVDDETMVSATRWRLGTQLFCGPVRRCKLCSAGKSGEAEDAMQERAMRGECGLTMDSYGDHPQVCCLGAGLKVRPDPIVEQIGHAVRDLGRQARVECSMMWVYRKKGKAIAPGRLDVYAFGHAGLMEVMVDVAVKHPCTRPLMHRAALSDGYAAKLAEREKLKGT